MNIAKCVTNWLVLVVTLVFSIGKIVWGIHGNSKEELRRRMSKDLSASVKMSSL